MIKIISADFQKDFTMQGGNAYKPRKSVQFVKNVVTPFLMKKKIKIAEIISDYRQPRLRDRGDLCHPGTQGYESEIPKEAKFDDIWIKCMNSPLWTRGNIGIQGKKPSLPYQDTLLFNKWLKETVGEPNSVEAVVLIGLTVDCCVLCTAQELDWRGYKILILEEGVDTYLGDEKEKKNILSNPPLTNWAGVISWNELKKKL